MYFYKYRIDFLMSFRVAEETRSRANQNIMVYYLYACVCESNLGFQVPFLISFGTMPKLSNYRKKGSRYFLKF